MKKLINWLLCKLGKHDNEFVNIKINYVLHDSTGCLYPDIANGTCVGSRLALYQQCKRCGFEKEVGT